jgi:dihydroorotate dehydrogenase
MGIYESVIRPLAFRMDPEKVHEKVMHLIERGLIPGLSEPLEKDSIELFGVKFPNRIGLAAGFDKNAIAVDFWHRFGFGFVEIGTVTWHAQPGNPKPRLFRLPADKALVNRMGFNNEGAIAVANRLANSTPKIPIGVNLGKSKITELDDAHQDYKQSFAVLRDHGDYFVVNVSSPNTPGLRSLQDREPLLRIFGALREIDSTKPMFVKIAPDLTEEALIDVVRVAEEMLLTGIIATNTTLSRDGLTKDPNEQGGLSGAPVREKSNQALKFIRENCDPKLVLIGVGGILTAADVAEKRALGAELVQLYTGWVYGGPHMVSEMLNQL